MRRGGRLSIRVRHLHRRHLQRRARQAADIRYFPLSPLDNCVLLSASTVIIILHQWQLSDRSLLHPSLMSWLRERALGSNSLPLVSEQILHLSLSLFLFPCDT